ncbi:DhnA family fructose-bisphosphate aldolase class Ia [Catenuloplanes nepalensis]|uniref:DhnA family fructose-bisphosphate aldolase class Ia n=1 Tax=Catenuloplanes nepalensis TaxID=587533 RepID=A0ABT9MY56_9ACTN|nr:aldolase [Catenuloplanes nepalensis]MDP9796171.1 DhnA family fructose-bisphosphate aldolase class Ia [Catenuloplanes nepalensis]
MPDIDVDKLRELRATNPEAIAERAANRRKGSLNTPDGRLMLVAADHPARGALSVRGDRTAMADRTVLLTRLVTALERPGVDGVLGTADVLEDLLLLGALDGKVAIGSMNRGGLAGAVFELDDRFTGYDAEAVARMGLDGGKMLVRIDPEDPATVRTMESAAKAVDALAQKRRMAMVEPFLSRRTDGTVSNDLSTEAVIKSVTIASGLGGTSAYTWLKLPVVDDMDAVMAATTLPTLLLGGDPSGSPEDTYARWGRALAAPGVRGLMVGRALLYPPDGDVAAAVDTAVSLVHGQGVRA